MISKSRLRSSAAILALCLGLAPLGGCSLIRTLFPSSEHEVERPELPKVLGRPSLLVFTKTNGFRHEEAIDAGVPALRAIAKKRDWTIYQTENGAIHNSEQLARFDAVIWFQVIGDVLCDPGHGLFGAFRVAAEMPRSVVPATSAAADQAEQ